MNSPSPTPLAGGFPIAAGALVGCFIGVALGQPSIGFLLGLGVGILIAAAMWLRARR